MHNKYELRLFLIKFGVPARVYQNIIIYYYSNRFCAYGFTVVSTIAEPVPGWIDTFNGPIGLMTACGKGVAQVTLANKDTTPDFMPVDLSIKAMIVAAYHRGTHKYFLLILHNNNYTVKLACNYIQGTSQN